MLVAKYKYFKPSLPRNESPGTFVCMHFDRKYKLYILFKHRYLRINMIKPSKMSGEPRVKKCIKILGTISIFDGLLQVLLHLCHPPDAFVLILSVPPDPCVLVLSVPPGACVLVLSVPPDHDTILRILSELLL